MSLIWVLKILNKHEQDSSEVNVFHSISHDNIYGPFLFAEKSINGNIHLDLLIKSPQFNLDSISITAKNKHT